MNISRRVWLILGAVIIVAALAILYLVFYSPQAGERNDLNARLSRAEVFLAGLANQKNDLQDQLASATATLDVSKSQFPQSVESIEYGEYLFEIASECNVNLNPLNFPQPINKTVGGVTYSVVSLSLPVSGTLVDIFRFIDTIRTDERFASTDVKSVNVDIGGSKATVNMDIYGYKG